jgi:Ca2+-binding EF-hand superfamily protein
LDSIDKNYPFAASFGKATTREEAIESSQNVFESLARSECDTLQFEVLCQTAMRSDGSMDKAKIRSIIKMFRPSRNGQITKLEFMKSIDE